MYRSGAHPNGTFDMWEQVLVDMISSCTCTVGVRTYPADAHGNGTINVPLRCAPALQMRTATVPSRYHCGRNYIQNCNNIALKIILSAGSETTLKPIHTHLKNGATAQTQHLLQIPNTCML